MLGLILSPKIFCHMSISVFSLSLYSFNKLKFWVKVEMPCLNYSWGKEEPYRQQHTYILPHHPASLPQTIYHLELRVSSHICKYRCCLKGQSYQYRILDLSLQLLYGQIIYQDPFNSLKFIVNFLNFKSRSISFLIPPNLLGYLMRIKVTRTQSQDTEMQIRETRTTKVVSTHCYMI